MAAVEHVFENVARATDGCDGTPLRARARRVIGAAAELVRAGGLGLYWPAHAPVAELVDAQG